MPTGLYTRWEFLTLKCRNSRLDIIELATLRIWSCLFIKNQDQNVKLRAFLHLQTAKIDCFNVDGGCDHFKTVFEAMGCYYHFCFCQEASPSLTEQDIERGNKKRERWMICDENTLKRKVTKWKKCGNVTGGKVSKTMTRSKITSKLTFQ